jgi:hypothetical protein
MAGSAHADCKLLQLAEFHLDPNFRTPTIDGAMNGHPVKIAFDTGASFSMVTRHDAERLGLTMARLPGVRAYGVGGDTEMYVADIKELRVDKFVKSRMRLEVAGDADVASDVAVVLGDDFFAQADVELDLANHVVRLFEPKDCAPEQLIYWGAAYSQMRLMPWERDSPKAQVQIEVNGHRILAALDTGASVSVIDTTVAAAAGVTRASAGAAPGAQIRGEGPHLEDSWIGRFDDVALGDEKVRNVRLQVVPFLRGFQATETGDLTPRRLDDTPQMFIGADFFSSHRVFLANHEHLVMFSYVGGPVFKPDVPEHDSAKP